MKHEQPHIAAQQTLDARKAGMPAASSRRWPHYLAMKTARGEQPITLDEAVRQCAEARRAVTA